MICASYINLYHWMRIADGAQVDRGHAQGVHGGGEGAARHRRSRGAACAQDQPQPRAPPPGPLACARARVRVCVRASERACVQACACARARTHASGYIFVDVDCMSRCRTCVSIRICKRVGASARVTWRPTSTGSASLRKRIRITRPCPPAAG